MRNVGKTKLVVVALVAMLALGAAAMAFACTALATLDLAPSTAASGSAVTGTASGFSSNPLDGPIEIRFNGPSGPVVFSGRPALLSSGLEFQMTVPNVADGSYIVIAMQHDLLGRPIAGSPARAILRVAN